MLKLLKFKRLFASIFLLSFLLTLVFAPFAKAAEGTWYNQGFEQWHTKVYDSSDSEIFGERYTAAQVQWVFYGFGSFLLHLPFGGNDEGLTCILSKGSDVETCIDTITLTIQSIVDFISYDSTSPGGAGGILATISTNPISFVSYISNIMERWSLVPEVGAQGFGFGRLNPVLDLWRVSRNIAFFLIVIVIIALSFMIMFRVKIAPQVVISVQSALPKIAIALLLATFSYAIAGLLIDLMYVVMGIVAMAFTSLSGLSDHGFAKMFEELVNSNLIGMLWAWWALTIIAALVNILSATPITGFLLFVFAIFFVVVIIISSFKILIMFVKNYVQILLLVIVAPLQIVFGAVAPAAGFGSWLKSILAALAVYPVAAVLILLAFFFLAAGFPDWMANIGVVRDVLFGFGSNLEGEAWIAPFSAVSTFDNTNILWILTSVVIITIIPKTVDIIKGMIEGKPFAYGTAIGESFGQAGTGVGYIAGEVGRTGRIPLTTRPVSPRVQDISNTISTLISYLRK